MLQSKSKSPDSPRLAATGPASQADPALLATLRAHRRGSLLRRVVILLLVLAAAAAGVFMFMRGRGPAPTRAWKTVAAERGPLVSIVSATGTLQPVRTVTVGAELSGRIATVDVDYNDHVSIGQVLARIDTEAINSELEQQNASLAVSKAAVSEARANLAEAKAAYDRVKKLAAQGVVSKEAVDTAKAAHDRTRARLDSAKAQLRLGEASIKGVETRLAKAIIVSPIDGVVLSRVVEPGSTVAASFQAPTLFVLATDLAKMTIYANIDEADVGAVAVGQTASFTVDAWPGREFSARVDAVRLEPVQVDNVVTYRGVLSVENPDGALRPGMTATVDVTTQRQEDVLRVPNAALRYTPPRDDPRGFRFGPPRENAQPAADTKGVWILVNGAPKHVPLTLGETDGLLTAVSSGELQVGDLVIVGAEEPK